MFGEDECEEHEEYQPGQRHETTHISGHVQSDEYDERGHKDNVYHPGETHGNTLRLSLLQ